VSSIPIKSAAELDKMRAVNKVVGLLLKALYGEVKPGVTTADLDLFAANFIRDHGATPAFLGYHGYPATICASVNEQVVHGIPGKVKLEEGDIIGVDVGAVLDGFVGDAARTYPVGRISAETQKLLTVTREALDKFEASGSFKVGVDAQVAVVSQGAGGAYDSETLQKPILGFVFDEKGLIGDLSLKGSKIKKIEPR